MNTNDMRQGHTIKRFDGELSHLHSLVLEMGGLVVDQIERSARALDDEDVEAARKVIARDREVNRLDVLVDEEVVRLLALRTPVAGDLRNIMSVAKSVNDLERIGDEARKVARLVEVFYAGSGAEPPAGLVQSLLDLADYGAGMVRTVLEAFDELNVQKAVEVIARDDRIEEKFRAALRQLSTYVLEDPRNVGWSIESVLGLRALERIGGHAKNIAGYVIYLRSGRDVRHVDLDTIVDEVLAEGS
jgi:phosphate transport system protein